MKVAIQNIEFLFDEGTHAHSGEEWQYTPEHVAARIEHFGELFSKIDADILLLQEIASKSVIERIIERSGIDYAYFFAEPDQNGVGNVALYKQKDAKCESVPAVSSLPVFVEDDEDVAGKRIWSRRDFVHLETTYNGKKLHVVGLHIKANFLVPQKDASGQTLPMDTQIGAADGLIRSEMFRFSQAKKVRQLVDGFFAEDPDAQVIVGGDFNSEESGSVFRIISGVIPDAPDSLVDTVQQVPEESRYSIPIKNGKKSVIDHLLVSRNLMSRVVDVKILNEYIFENHNVAPHPVLVGSDHAPVIAELQS